LTTIKDVASFANVSVATVSRVLNNKGNVKRETKLQVEKAIKYLNYSPNDLARNLFTGNSKMIALLIPDITNPFFPELASSIESAANEHGYTLILCNTAGNQSKELTYLSALRRKCVDGIVLVSNTLDSKQILESGIPTVVLDRETDFDITSITVNNYEGGKQAVRFLKDIGCDKIAHIAGSDNISSTKNRKKGYIEMIKEDPWIIENLIVPGGYSAKESFKSTIKILTTHPDINGIFASNDVMAVGVLEAVKSLDISVPKDLAIIGFDGIELGEITTPTITTMSQPITAMGRKAVDLLIKKMQYKNDEISSEVFQVELIKREST